jgi:hypothetical protein
MKNNRIDWSHLNTLFLREGELRFANTMIRQIQEGNINKDNFSLGGLWKAMGEPRINDEMARMGQFLREADIREAMDSSAFPKITGALINSVIQEAYDIYTGVGDNLVRKIPSTQQDDTIVGFTSIDQVEEVVQGGPYPEGSYGEKYHKIRNRKFGKLIGVTAEMIKFDQTGQMIMRAQDIGNKAASKHEEIIMRAICESASTGPYASWRPNGTSTALYSDTSTDPYSGATLDNSITDKLADETDLDSAFTNFATFKDETGDYLQINPDSFLCGPATIGVARKIAFSQQYTPTSTPAGVPKPARYTFSPYSSPWVGGLLGSPYWLFGEFTKQFVLTQVFPLEVFQEKANSPSEFERDVLYRFKTRFMEGCGAITNRYVIRSTGAS